MPSSFSSLHKIKCAFLSTFVAFACNTPANCFTLYNPQHSPVLAQDTHLHVAASGRGRNRPRPGVAQGGRRSGQRPSQSKRYPVGTAAIDANDQQSVMLPKRDQDPMAGSINCEHFQACPGCTVETKVDETDIVNAARRYFSSPIVQKNLVYGVEADTFGIKIKIPSDVRHWRTQAKLAVAKKGSTWGRDGCTFGLYERGTHDVLPIPRCVVHHPSINRAIEALVRATERVGIAAYNENTGEGCLRYVQCQVERSTGRICLTLVWNAERLKDTQPALSRLVKEVKRFEPRLFHSIWCHCNDSAGNLIFARGAGRWHPINGPEFTRESIPGTDPEKKEGMLYFTPQAFRQGNLDGFDHIAQHVAMAVPGGSKVCELYAGVGVLGLTALSHRFRESMQADTDGEWFGEDENDEKRKPLEWLRCSDENPNNPRCFNRSLGSMPQEATGKRPKFLKGKGKGKRWKGKNKRPDSVAEDGTTLSQLMAQMEQGTNQGGARGDRAGGKVSYLVSSASGAIHKGQALGADVMIVDPPRKGLEDEVLVQLCKPINPNQDYAEDATYLSAPRHVINWTNDVRKLIYVSCGFDALARDCDRLLTANGGWKLESATGYVLFPGSNHVETVAIFTR